MERTLYKHIIDGLEMDQVIRDHEYSMVSRHLHETYELYYLTEGQRYYFIERQTYLVKSGDVVLIEPNLIHKTSIAGESYHNRILLQIDRAFMDGVLKACGLENMETVYGQDAKILHIPEDKQPVILELFASMEREMSQKQKGWLTAVKLQLARLLLEITRCPQITEQPMQNGTWNRIGTGHGEKRHIGFTGNSLGQHGLTGSRRADEQSPFRNLTAQFLIFIRVFQEIDDLHDFDFGLFQTGNILKSDINGRILVEHLGFGFPDVENPALTATLAARHTAHDEDPDADDQDPGKNPGQQVGPHIAPRFETERYILLVLGQRAFEIALEIVQRTDVEHELRSLLGQTFVLFLLGIGIHLVRLEKDFGALLVDDIDLLDIALLDHHFDIIPVGLLGYIATPHQAPSNQKDGNQGPHPIDIEAGTFAAQIGGDIVIGI